MMEAHQPSSSIVITELQQSTDNHEQSSVNIVLKQSEKNESDKKVKFDQNTVDNELLNRKKSKCCCIYQKPKKFDDPPSSSSSDDDDLDNCCTNHCHAPANYHKQVFIHKKNKE